MSRDKIPSPPSKRPEPTKSLSSPKNSRRGCLCRNKRTYSIKCCNGDLGAQGIGIINKPPTS